MRNCKNGPLVFIRILFGCFQISSKILRILTGENSYAIGRSRTNRNFSQLFASIPISTNPIGHQLGYHPKTIKSLIPVGPVRYRTSDVRPLSSPVEDRRFKSAVTAVRYDLIVFVEKFSCCKIFITWSGSASHHGDRDSRHLGIETKITRISARNVRFPTGRQTSLAHSRSA